MYRVVVTATLALLLAAPGAGAAPRTLSADLIFTGEAEGDESGFQVEIADLDGDGTDDLVIGAWKNDTGGNASGAVYIEYGPLKKGGNLASADVKLFTPAAGEYVGEGPLGIADLDGDEADDLIVGAPGSFYATQPGSPGKIGEAFLLYGGKRLRGELELPKVADVRFTGIHMTEWLGFGSSGVGDIDGDAREDLVVGAPATAGFSGAAYLFYGNKKRLKGDVPVAKADAIFLGGRAGEMFGYEAVGGDLNGDDTDDLSIASKPLVGGPAGVYMFEGGARLTGVIPAAGADAQMLFPTIDYFSGPALASGADVTGDGIDDLVAGVAPSLSPAGEASTYIVSGRKGSFPSGLQMPGDFRIRGAGNAVAIGDLNGDRRADLVTGDSSNEGGSAYVFYGPLAEDLTLDDADATFAGEPDSEAGSALAIGHLDGDRRGDLAIGAPADAGRTYVVRGRSK